MGSKVSTKTEELNVVVESNLKFLEKIHHALADSSGEQSNLALSSFSISSVLALALAGAKGATHDQMQEALGLPKDGQIKNGYEQIFTILKRGDENFTMNMANQIFFSKKFNLLESYLDYATKYFLVKPKSLDFEKGAKACKIINSWVEKQTHHKIKSIASPNDVNKDTIAVLVNAVYLKMKWKRAFNESHTKNREFYLTPNSTVNTPLMIATDQFKVCSIDEMACDVLDMPCKGNQFSMLFFLPKTHGDFQQMESNFSHINLKKLHQTSARTSARTYDVTIPKFKLEAKHDLNDNLRSLGINDMFDEEKADLSGMATLAPGENLYVSKVSQKVFIEVAEDGCEAAAATAVYCVVFLSDDGRYISNPKFTCNRPFLFVIRSNATGIILFNGRIMNPNEDGTIA